MPLKRGFMPELHALHLVHQTLEFDLNISGQMYRP
jgi:hypothetical protein